MMGLLFVLALIVGAFVWGGFGFFLVGIIGLLYWATKKQTSGSDESSDSWQGSTNDQLWQRNIEWAEFIAGYQTKVHSKSEKALLDRMLSDIAAKGLPLPNMSTTDTAAVTNAEAQELVLPDFTEALTGTQAAAIRPKTAAEMQLDNISMLLYFGAFLFVASVGLFVAFGDIGGFVKAFAVLAVSLLLYGSGIWIYKNRPKLSQVGMAFVGIGMASAPFFGLAVYNYVLHQTNGTAIWFATSLLCLLMYVHALFIIRKTLISYILIFTFLSLFESAVSITVAPIY